MTNSVREGQGMSEEQAILKVLDGLAAAWNAGDAAAHARPFVEDADSSVSGAETPDEGRESTLTYVLVREDDGWRIASFQNTRRIPAFMPGGAGAS
jgi:ketosteroid isomerase-like protein